MIISHYNVIVLCRQLAPGLCVRCVAAYSWDDQQYDPCGTCTGRMSMPRLPPHYFYDYTLLAVLAFLVFLSTVLLHMPLFASDCLSREIENDFVIRPEGGTERTIIASATIRRSRSNWMKRCPMNEIPENCNRTLNTRVDVKSSTIISSVNFGSPYGPPNDWLVTHRLRGSASSQPRSQEKPRPSLCVHGFFFQISFGDVPETVRYLILALSGC